jgi:amino acid transporter
MATELQTAVAGTRLKRNEVRVVTAFFMIFILVSGGAFGIEDMVSSSGPGLTILLLLLLPVIWSTPMALVAAELGSALPGEGGFYIWVRRALGNFWGFQAGWWWSLSVFVDSSVYVVLGVGYLRNWVNTHHYVLFGSQLHISHLTAYLIGFAIILVFTIVNVIGVNLVAVSSTVFSILILAPFFVLIAVGLAKWNFNPLTPVTTPGVGFFGSSGVLGLGLALGVWMYSGYESMSTLSGEIRNPQRVIPKALMLAVPFIILMYVLPTVASLAGYGHWDTFATQAGDGYLSFVEIGRKLGGSALGVALLASALLGNLALYLDYLASGARPLFALSADRLVPRGISYASKRWRTPIVAIVLMAVLNAILTVGPFQKLVVIDVILFTSSYVLIFISAVRLRRTEPDLKRPFRVRTNTLGMALMAIPPILIVLFTIYVNAIDRSTFVLGWSGFKVLGVNIGWYGIGGFIALVSGPIWYWAAKKITGGPRTDPATAGDAELAIAEAEAAADAGEAAGLELAPGAGSVV